MAAKKQTPSSTPTTGTTLPPVTTTTVAPSVDPNAYQAQNPITQGGYITNSNTGVSDNYIAPGRNASGLANGTTVIPYYNLSTEPRETLAYMQDEVERANFLKRLYERGWYDAGTSPGGGLSDEDEKAVYKLMYASNLMGVQWTAVMAAGKRSPFANTESADKRFRVSSTEDLVEIANRTALTTIGRKLSDAEASKFSRAYQSSQQAEASGGMTAPNTEVFFKNRIEQQYGGESDGYKYLSAISNVAKLMENM
jgi:ribosomal protein S20